MIHKPNDFIWLVWATRGQMGGRDVCLMRAERAELSERLMKGLNFGIQNVPVIDRIGEKSSDAKITWARAWALTPTIPVNW